MKHNEKKITFILCVNNNRYLQETLYYINRLYIPQGYEVDIITITDAESMTSGYNEAMKESDAKYKIYMHQDVFILKRDFIIKILELFTDTSIGMIGLVGYTELPENCIQWYGIGVGNLISNNFIETSTSNYDFDGKFYKVKTIDGLLMATQYDLPWRDDLFDGWDFYDMSQSLEFRNAGYDVVVPKQETPWVLHYDGVLNMKNYYKYRRIFIKEYL